MAASPTALVIVPAVSAAGWTISIIAILIALVIAWNAFGVREDVARVRRRWRDRGS
jgi:hypothetical protein